MQGTLLPLRSMQGGVHQFWTRRPTCYESHPNPLLPPGEFTRGDAMMLLPLTCILETGPRVPVHFDVITFRDSAQTVLRTPTK